MKIKLILLGIVILASILRFWSLDKYPAGFNADEASIGYNAYSLLQTGKDEYGTSWPLVFKSFGDFKPGLFVYFVMPFTAVLGLNEWAVRLPSAIFGIGTIFLVYLLALKIFKNQYIALISSFLLAIAPWHIHFSRGGWETNVATFFIALAVLLFMKGLEETKFLYWSFVAFLVSMYTYQSPRLIVPVFLIVLFFLYRKALFSKLYKIQSRKNLVGILLLILLSFPLILQFSSGQGGARFQGLSFLSDLGPRSRVNELRGEHQNAGSLFAKIEHNKLTAFGPGFLGHYLDHFKPDFLFINGDPLIRNKVPETGQFYLIEIFFLIIGLVSLTKNRFEHTKLLIAWILIAPLASSLTFQTPHALRALNMVIPLTIICGLGLWSIINSSKGILKTVILMTITVIISFEIVHYLESYYVHYPKRYPLAWEYGFSQMVGKLETIEGKYKNIVITDRYDQPYILVLFYKKYDPRKYQPQAHLSERDKFNFGTVRSFDNYQFRSFKADDVKNAKNDTLFIGIKEEMQNIKGFDKIDFPNGEPAFIFAEGGT